MVLNFYLNGLSVPELLSLKQLSLSPYQVMDSKFSSKQFPIFFFEVSVFSPGLPFEWRFVGECWRIIYVLNIKFCKLRSLLPIVISNWFRCTSIRNQFCPFALRKFFRDCHWFSFSRFSVRNSSIQPLWNTQKYLYFNILRNWIILTFFSFRY